VPDPVIFPKTGVYHPRAPGQVFADPLAYLRWAGVDPADPQRRPVVALALHQQYIASMQTALHRRPHRPHRGQRRRRPAVLHAHDGRGQASPACCAPAGRPLADVLINTQIMLNAEDAAHRVCRLGVPVLQAMPYRRGEPADWEKDPHGVALMDVPFYLAQPEYAGVTDIQVAAATRGR
jgi:cobaltochelatase CobN